MTQEKKTQKKKYTPQQTADFQKTRQEQKLKKAGERDTVVVSTKTMEAADTTSFIDKVDYTMSRIRLTFGSRRSKITAAQFEHMSGFVSSINGLMNHFLSIANKVADIPYKPPRGYVDLSKQGNLKKASEELDRTIDLLMAEKERIDKQISSIAAKQAEQTATAAAKTPAPVAAKKAPARAKADAGAPAAAAA
jgi:hypothetical protein